MRTVVFTAAVAALQMLAMSSVKAGVILTYEEVGGDVVVTGNGTINLADLVFNSNMSVSAGISPSGRYFMSGPSGRINFYGGTTGPTSFGLGGLTNASSGSGDMLGISIGFVAVPEAYVSGASLASTATFTNASFASLGVNAGTYTFTWGLGQTADFLTVQVGRPAVAEIPEPGSLCLVGTAFLTAAGLSRRRNRRSV